MEKVGERWSRNPDGSTERVPAGMGFEEWKGKFVGDGRNQLTTVLQDSIINTRDDSSFTIGKSVGAKAKNYDVMDLGTGELFHFVEGSRIQNVEVFAGKGTRVVFRKAEKCQRRYEIVRKRRRNFVIFRRRGR